MSKTLPLSEVKTHFPSIVAGVAEREEEVVVTRNGKPAAVLVSYDEYARVRATLAVLADPEMMREIRWQTVKGSRGAPRRPRSRRAIGCSSPNRSRRGHSHIKR